MKFNWKMLVALALVVGAIYWAIDSTRSQAYAGTTLGFDIGSGIVTMTNPSDAAVPVQVVGTGSRSFTVSSPMEGMSGSSTRQGSGSTTSHLFEFDLPPGVSTFSVARGTNVTFAADSETRLEATVQSVSDGEARTTLIVAAAVVLGSLFYISKSTGHRWIGMLRGQAAPVIDLKPAVESVSGGQGQNLRSYGDNRANPGD